MFRAYFIFLLGVTIMGGVNGASNSSSASPSPSVTLTVSSSVSQTASVTFSPTISPTYSPTITVTGSPSVTNTLVTFWATLTNSLSFSPTQQASLVSETPNPSSSGFRATNTTTNSFAATYSTSPIPTTMDSTFSSSPIPTTGVSTFTLSLTVTSSALPTTNLATATLSLTDTPSALPTTGISTFSSSPSPSESPTLSQTVSVTGTLTSSSTVSTTVSPLTSLTPQVSLANASYLSSSTSAPTSISTALSMPSLPVNSSAPMPSSLQTVSSFPTYINISSPEPSTSSTSSASSSASVEASASHTSTGSPIPTPCNTPTTTATSSAVTTESIGFTLSPSSTASASSSVSASNTPSSHSSPSATSSASASQSSSGSATETMSATPTLSSTPTATVTQTPSPTLTPSTTPSQTPSLTSTLTPLPSSTPNRNIGYCSATANSALPATLTSSSPSQACYLGFQAATTSGDEGAQSLPSSVISVGGGQGQGCFAVTIACNAYTLCSSSSFGVCCPAAYMASGGQGVSMSDPLVRVYGALVLSSTSPSTTTPGVAVAASTTAFINALPTSATNLAVCASGGNCLSPFGDSCGMSSQYSSLGCRASTTTTPTVPTPASSSLTCYSNVDASTGALLTIPVLQTLANPGSNFCIVATYVCGTAASYSLSTTLESQMCASSSSSVIRIYTDTSPTSFFYPLLATSIGSPASLLASYFPTGYPLRSVANNVIVCGTSNCNTPAVDYCELAPPVTFSQPFSSFPDSFFEDDVVRRQLANTDFRRQLATTVTPSLTPTRTTSLTPTLTPSRTRAFNASKSEGNLNTTKVAIVMESSCAKGQKNAGGPKTDCTPSGVTDSKGNVRMVTCANANKEDKANYNKPSCSQCLPLGNQYLPLNSTSLVCSACGKDRKAAGTTCVSDKSIRELGGLALGEEFTAPASIFARHLQGSSGFVVIYALSGGTTSELAAARDLTTTPAYTQSFKKALVESNPFFANITVAAAVPIVVSYTSQAITVALTGMPDTVVGGSSLTNVALNDVYSSVKAAASTSIDPACSVIITSVSSAGSGASLFNSAPFRLLAAGSTLNLNVAATVTAPTTAVSVASPLLSLLTSSSFTTAVASSLATAGYTSVGVAAFLPSASPSVSPTPTKTPSPTPQPVIAASSPSSSTNTPAIVGGVVGGVAGLALLAAFVWYGAPGATAAGSGKAAAAAGFTSAAPTSSPYTSTSFSASNQPLPPSSKAPSLPVTTFRAALPSQQYTQYPAANGSVPSSPRIVDPNRTLALSPPSPPATLRQTQEPPISLDIYSAIDRAEEPIRAGGPSFARPPSSPTSASAAALFAEQLKATRSSGLGGLYK